MNSKNKLQLYFINAVLLIYMLGMHCWFHIYYSLCFTIL